ncbi:cytochrome c biogenesis heme-transporting ATPase CcmA [Marinobacter halodurans]|uniref:Cytochrome c biogenesis heme-transporting ATPase CcmA n=1 Tax=Marinobacter halodurans TaxID=2528979 RepID=A0ABY1ZT25_9GAMM|nr:cytochrome c biogenesis heme-transporting ATPase CcmA [Marinobacter halodurans]TBW59414.1 cytochrome c biogenesis heme-transporting ATPase CcmA [Marinobacter halodurans]
MPIPLLQATGLSCERDERLLFTGVDLAVRAGSLLRVEGPNGAGKTTLLRILAGLHSGYEGEILWCGESVHRVREHFLRNLLYIGHRPGIKPLLTPLENLAALLACHPGSHRDPLEGALEAVELLPFAHMPCHHLSAGQQRRVALARLYLSDEPLWILDEAFTAIDRAGVESLERLLEKRMAAGGAIILTTHHRLSISGAESLDLLAHTGEALAL